MSLYSRRLHSRLSFDPLVEYYDSPDLVMSGSSRKRMSSMLMSCRLDCVVLVHRKTLDGCRCTTKQVVEADAESKTNSGKILVLPRE